MARLIVCERTGLWAAAFRRELREPAGPRGAAGVISIHESRGRAECIDLLDRWPASLVAMEVSGGHFAAVLDWTAETVERFPEARIVILSRLESLAAEWVLREAGAVHVVRSPRNVTTVVKLAVMQLALAPRVEVSYAESIAHRLPWGKEGGAKGDV